MDGEHFCPRCNRTVLVLRKPRFDGFTKVGEEMTCTVCGMVLDAPEPAEKTGHTDSRDAVSRNRLSSLLGEKLPDKPVLADDGTAGRLCRHCLHYTVNPFRQWCGLHRRDVEATDTCPKFTPRPESDGDN